MILPRSLPWHRPLRSLLPLAALPLLGGCDLVVLNPAGDVARQQADVVLISTGLMLLIIVPVMALTVWFAWKYRASNEKATYKPDWDHSTALELVIWSGPLLIVIALGALTWISTHLLDPYRPIGQISSGKPVPQDQKPLEIQVVSLDWFGGQQPTARRGAYQGRAGKGTFGIWCQPAQQRRRTARVVRRPRCRRSGQRRQPQHDPHRAARDSGPYRSGTWLRTRSCPIP